MASLTLHFTSAELGYDGAPASVRPALQQMAQLLEQFRALTGGVPYREVSGYRSADRNAAVGGVADSAHLSGSAADFTPDLTLRTFGRRILDLEELGELPPYGELILYPADGHVHLTLPYVGGRREKLIKLADGTFLPLRRDTLEQLGAGPASSTAFAAVVVAILLAALFLSRSGALRG